MNLKKIWQSVNNFIHAHLLLLVVVLGGAYLLLGNSDVYETHPALNKQNMYPPKISV